MAETKRRQLVASVMDELHAYIDAVDAFETAVAGRFGLERMELRWFAALAASDGMTLDELDEKAGAQGGDGVAATLRRLEEGGHAERGEGDPPVYRASADATRVLTAAMAPIDAAAAGLHRYGAEELGIVRNFLRVGRRFYEHQLRRFGDRVG